MESTILISENRVQELLEWNSLVEVIEYALVSVSKKMVTQQPRTFTKQVNGDGLLLTMPGSLASKNEQQSGLMACKLVTMFPKNSERTKPLPRIMANILLFNSETGELKAVIAGTEITAWRTAAASVVATKYLHQQRYGRECRILAIIGAGTQGRSHAIAFQHFFKFDEVRIWNHHPEKAVELVKELKALNIPNVYSCSIIEECVKNADVIVTATFSSTPLIDLKLVKSNVHINAVGAGINHHSELSEDIYKTAWICVDHWAGANAELSGLNKIGVTIQAEVGEIIIEKQLLPDKTKITVFHSLGMAAEDTATAELIYNKHLSKNCTT